MMKIALLGAPGAGKTKIARRVVRRLNAESRSWGMVDGYVDRLTSRTGASFGPDQTLWAFRYNLQVASERWTLEDELLHKGLSSITCGSVYESIIYAAAQRSVIPRLGNEQLIVEETYISEIMMQAFGALATRTFDYDALFYLPLTVDDEDSWGSVVNAKLPEVLAGSNKVAITLEGTDRQKVNRAEEVIHAIAKAFANYDQRPVREGNESSQGDEPGPQLVPNLLPEGD